MRWHFLAKDKSQIEDHKGNVDPSLASSYGGSTIPCPLCGKKFYAGEATSCASCALAVKCGLVMCPNCSYEFAP